MTTRNPHKCDDRTTACKHHPYEPTAEKAARKFAEHVGIEAREGGWLYWPSGKPMIQGWHNWIIRLTNFGVIAPKHMTDDDGTTHTRYAIVWRTGERMYAR